MVKKYIDIDTDRGDFEFPLLSELKNQTFIISTVKFGKGTMGRYAIVGVGQCLYRTSSVVVIDQLEKIETDITKEGVEVTLREIKKYMKLE